MVSACCFHGPFFSSNVCEAPIPFTLRIFWHCYQPTSYFPNPISYSDIFMALYFSYPLFFFSSFTLRAVPWFIELKSDGHWVSCVNQALGLGSCCDIKIASPPRIPNDSHYFSRESEHCYLIYSYWIPDDSHHFEVSLRVDISHWGSMAVAICRTQKLCF